MDWRGSHLLAACAAAVPKRLTLAGQQMTGGPEAAGYGAKKPSQYIRTLVHATLLGP